VCTLITVYHRTPLFLQGENEIKPVKSMEKSSKVETRNVQTRYGTVVPRYNNDIVSDVNKTTDFSFLVPRSSLSDETNNNNDSFCNFVITSFSRQESKRRLCLSFFHFLLSFASSFLCRLALYVPQRELTICLFVACR
jgi:hypothetical protein